MDKLLSIYQNYHSIIARHASEYSHRPEVVAGIIMRESNGVANALGDGGHGYGLMQIDDRSFPEFCAHGSWKDPDKNISMGCQILRDNTNSVSRICAKFNLVPSPVELERMGIAAYNAGANSPVHFFRLGEDIDSGTTGKDYSTNVLQFADQYLEIMAS